jgi:hypothetical protein
MADTRITRVPAIPDIPSGADKTLAPFLTAVKQNLDVLNGTVGDSLDRAALLRDIKLLPNITRLVSARNLADGVIRADTTAPGAPRNLVVAGLIVSNRLSWTNPTDDDLDHIEVWASETQYRDDAARVGVTTKPNNTFDHINIDTRKAYYYWIRAVDQAGNFSPWSPGDALGGYLAPAPVGDTVNDLLAAMTQDDLYGTVHKVVADSFQIVQPSAGLTEGRKVFVVGKINDLPAVGIDGNVVVDGSILARHIDADQITGQHISAQAKIALSEGGSLFAGNGNVLVYTGDDLNGHGFIVVAEDGGVNEHGEITVGARHMVLDAGDISFYEWVGTHRYTSKSLKNVVSGSAQNGETVVLGYFPSTPKVTLYPQSLQCNVAGRNQDQYFALNATNMREIDPDTGADSPGSRFWAFTAKAILTISAGSFATSTGLPEVGGASDTLESGTVTTEPRTSSIRAYGTIKSNHVSNSLQMNRRATIFLVVDGTAWNCGDIAVGTGATAFDREVSGLVPGVHSFFVRVVFADSGGGTDISTTTSASYPGTLSWVDGPGHKYAQASFSAPAGFTPTGWLLSGSYSYRLWGSCGAYAFAQASANVSDNMGGGYDSGGCSGSANPPHSGSFDRSGSFNLSKSGGGAPGGYLGYITINTSKNAGNNAPADSVQANATVSPSATLTVNGTSTVGVPDALSNALNCSSYSSNLSADTVLAAGVLGYLAVGE